MKFSIQVDSNEDPNQVGELLRRKFFVGDGLGCYSTFTYASNVEDCGQYTTQDNNKVSVARMDGIEMRWFWDGDGVLGFLFEDGSCILNYDCKKDYRWEPGDVSDFRSTFE